jgi:hypothetical protein
MKPNFLILLLASIIPMIMGFIWYHPKVFGTKWKNLAGIDDTKMKGANMPLIFIASFVLSFLLASSVQFMVIHQWGIYSILSHEPGMKDPNSEISLYVKDFMTRYGHNYRTFKHGVFHGIMAGILFVLPVLGINAMFERKGIKYIAINVGYWAVTLALMGGVICQYS